MAVLFSRKRWYYLGAALMIGCAGYLIVAVGRPEPAPVVSTTVERGTVEQLVSISGIVETDAEATLGFPVTGTVTNVAVRTGEEVAAGDVIARLDTRSLEADRADARAALSRAEADRQELLSGITSQARSVAVEQVALKEAALERTRADQERAVQNAYRTLLSSSLAARSDDPDESATPPVVSGTYTCDTEGRYILDVFSSNSESGYSFRLSGLESGTYVASTDQPISFGSCGLRVEFTDSDRYSNTRWLIDIPNQNATTFTINQNAYELAQTNAASRIALAEQELALARADAQNTTAPARAEAVARANAAVSQALAQLSRVESALADRTLRAPFAGTVVEVDVAVGETVTTAPVFTLLANTDFSIKTRVPEIDMGKLAVGQTAKMVFDARPDEPVLGTIDYIAPNATLIDGVAYYEARVIPNTQPEWLLSGFNADVDIITAVATNTLRIPTRFVSNLTDNPTVQLQNNEVAIQRPIIISLVGNDGYVAIADGLTEGDRVVAP